ncbi:MAG: hypothetical protein LQ349_004892 [Xanthoria aureola]|nr:MAG: hypothetical protein LQ349_004892 [Xanthoria aureola]
MKFFTMLSPLVLGVVTMSSGITATPVTGSATSSLANTNLVERALEPVVIQDILNLASDLFAIQLVGAQSRLDQLTNLCVNFDPTPLISQGYNFTLIHNIFCEAGWATFLTGPAYTVPSNAYIQSLTTTFSSYIWIFQAVGALANDPRRLSQLCRLIDPPSSAAVGQNATLVKDTVCKAAAGEPLPRVLELPVPFEALRRSRQGNGNGTVKAVSNMAWVKDL